MPPSRAAGRVTPDLVETVAKGQAQASPADPYRGALPPLREGKVALNFRLDPELHQRLRAAAHRADTSIQRIVEEAVRRHLDTVAP